MRPILLGLAAATLAGHAAAQGRARIGPTVSSIAIEDGSGTTHAYSSIGGTFAFITGDDGEIGLAVTRYGDLSSDNCVRRMTFVGVESNYYPVGPRGIAPFASTAIGLARVTDQDIKLLGCGIGSSPPQPTNQLGLGFGLGVRVNLGNQFAGFLEGRFFQVPNSAIQALEGRANVSLAFGKPRPSQLLNGTVGPAVGLLFPLSGPMEGRGPTLGVRFRRDTKKHGTMSLQIDYASLRVPSECPTDCEPKAILFAPGYEASVSVPWGRLYGELGPLIAGFPSQTADRGVAQGVQGGVGADILSGQSLMWNVNGRVLWLQRNNGDNVFLLQLGVGLSPKLTPAPGAH
jgi:hypothetical protein